MKRIIEDLINQDKGYNCAELILRACNKKFNLDIADEMLKCVKGFGGGMKVGSTCGIITGAIVAVTIILNTNKYSTNKEQEELIKNLYNEMKKELKDDSCTKLIEINERDNKSCWEMVAFSGDILEKYIFNNFEVR